MMNDNWDVSIGNPGRVGCPSWCKYAMRPGRGSVQPGPRLGRDLEAGKVNSASCPKIIIYRVTPRLISAIAPKTTPTKATTR